MASNCLDTTLVPGSGTSQAQRALAALAGDYARVDERNTADLILLARRYAGYLNYYDLTNTVAGDWAPFFSNDISVAIASVMAWPGPDLLPYLQELYDSIRQPAAPYTDPQKTFKYVFDLVFSLAQSLNKTLALVSTNQPYSSYLSVTIASRLSAPLFQLQNVYLALPAGLLPAAPIPADPLAPLADIASAPLSPADFHAQFAFLGFVPWDPPAGSNFPPVSLLTGATATAMLGNSLFTGLINAFLNGVIGMITGSATYLDQTLSGYPSHSPHYALYLSFLRLFRKAQDHLNEYTDRHLSFYYKKVLQLAPRPATPDTAHLVFTLQKGTTLHPLAKGLTFKAGKDTGGQDIFYNLTDDVVLNSASVQFLRSLSLRKTNPATQVLYALPQADTADGQGRKLTSRDQSWYPFGDPAVLASTGAPVATLGLALASNILFLNEGARTITLSFHTNDLQGFPGTGGSGIFTAQFTGDKKWFDAADYPATAANNVQVSATTTGTQSTVQVVISLGGDAPPIVPYSTKIHGGNFPKGLPMVRLQLADYHYYGSLKSIVVSSVDIRVSVDKVKNLVLQNSNGRIDASKPFKPFGDFPGSGAVFVVGSKEVFQKSLTGLQLNWDWAGTDSKSGQPLAGTSATVTGLKAGNWNLSLGSVAVTGPSSTVPIGTPQAIPQAPADFTDNSPYSITSVNGFIRLQLATDNYSMGTFLNNIQNNLNAHPPSTTHSGHSYNTTAPTLPPRADLLVTSEVSLTYTAIDAISLTDTAAGFGARDNFFYHLEPFGFREMHPFLFDTLDAADLLAPDNTMHLLPCFHLDNGATGPADTGGPASPDNGGELWIGLNNPIAGTVQSMLFQVSDGSSNPLKRVTTVEWYYLSGNNWIGLGDTVNDQTNNLSQSGLVGLNLPGNETFTNTRADGGLLWIKAVVKNNPDAVCRLIAVLSNAAKAQGSGRIDANIISKPAIPDGALKKTSQPYPSFGGRPKENNAAFDQRVSERLRHKHRAVTAWDYERLVLQQFPQIHKVKCLNHTRIVEATQDYSEVKPGHVMIITIPDLSLVTGANPLLPFTSVGLLTDIQDWLRPLMSPLVCLQVKNPQFESVRCSFKVDFINDNANSAYYRQLLDQEMQQFLMPWAFGAATDIEFGGKIEKSVLIDFVQDRPYVHFLTCFQLDQYVYQEDGSWHLLYSNVETAVASTARSVLVPYHDPSSPPPDNQITIGANCNCNGQ